MKKIAFPLVVLAVVVSAFAAVMTLGRELRAARAENIVLAERLSRAEAVAAAVMKVDMLYREAKDENAALAQRLTIVEVSSRNRMEFKDAVADRPTSKRGRARRLVALPGYSH